MVWLMYMAIPLIAWLSARYYAGHNAEVSTSSPEYTVFGNYPVMGLAEQLMSTFNVFIIMLIVMTVTQEYRSGQMRMILLRAYSFRRIYLAKWLVVLTALFLFQLAYFAASYLVGYVMFEQTDAVHLFYHDEPVSNGEAFFYNVGYYAIGFLTLIAVASVMMVIAVWSDTTTVAVGLGVGFLLLMIFSPSIVSRLIDSFNWSPYWQFLSIFQIQWLGIVSMMADPFLLYFNLSILGLYIVLGVGASYWIFTKQDQMI